MDVGPSRTGVNVQLADDTVVGAGVSIGNNVTVYPGVTIGDGCTILDGAVIGRLPIAGGGTSLPVPTDYAPVVIGAGCTIGCHSVLYTDVRLGERTLIGDHAALREGCRLGEDVVVGQLTSLHHHAHVGDRSRLSYLCIFAGSMEADVFVGPGVSVADDDAIYLSRFGLSEPTSVHAMVRRYAVIGVGARLLPHEVGEGAIVAGGAAVTRDVPPWTVVAGVPATHLRDVPAEWRERVLAHGAGKR